MLRFRDKGGKALAQEERQHDTTINRSDKKRQKDKLLGVAEGSVVTLELWALKGGSR